METEDTLSVDTADASRPQSKRQLAQQAIALAVQSRWQEAIEANQQIIDMAQDDAEAYNRLGKAYSELGQIADAREAYENSLRTDAANLIAQRNLDRLSRISDLEAAELARSAGAKLDPGFFMEETGKTAVTVLQSPAEDTILATLVAGVQVNLEPQDGQLAVRSMDQTYLGRIEDRLSRRLVRLMQTGNRYQAGIVGVDGSVVRIIIRETHQAAENAGRISFPPQTQETLPRPYLREGLLRRAGDVEDEDELDMDASEGDGDEDEDEAREFGFHEASLDEG